MGIIGVIIRVIGFFNLLQVRGVSAQLLFVHLPGGIEEMLRIAACILVDTAC